MSVSSRSAWVGYGVSSRLARLSGGWGWRTEMKTNLLWPHWEEVKRPLSGYVHGV